LESEPLDRHASLAMTRMWFKLIGNGSKARFVILANAGIPCVMLRLDAASRVVTSPRRR
jgi:hypothetical protein